MFVLNFPFLIRNPFSYFTKTTVTIIDSDFYTKKQMDEDIKYWEDYFSNK